MAWTWLKEASGLESGGFILSPKWNQQKDCSVSDWLNQGVFAAWLVVVEAENILH